MKDCDVIDKWRKVIEGNKSKNNSKERHVESIMCTCGEKVKLEKHSNRCKCGTVYKVLKY